MVSDSALDLLQDIVEEVRILTLQEADIVWSIDTAITGDFLLEFIRHISLERVEVVLHVVVNFALHLHVVNFGDKDDMVVTIAIFAEALNDVIQVGSGSLPIRRQVAHLDRGLLSKDILLDIVALGGGAGTHSLLSSELFRRLSTHCPHF